MQPVSDAQRAVTSARTMLLLDEYFFGSLALRLKLRQDAGCGTAWTDGASLGFDPGWIQTLTPAPIKTVVAHEVMHCACGHPWRIDGRDLKTWNIACDIAINGILEEAGFVLWDGAYRPDSEQKGKSAEWIYDRLPKQPQGGGGKLGQQQPGEVRPAPTGPDADGQDAPTEQEWKQAVQQAARAAKVQGSLPSALQRFVEEAVRPRVDWRAALRRFVQQCAQDDRTWKRPNRNYIACGLYLPALESAALGEIAFAVDTSGSMDKVDLAKAKAELLAVVDECQPSAVTVYYADARVAHCQRFERGEPVVFEPKGGGGTDFRPVVEAVNSQDNPPVCLVYVTDMGGTFPEHSEVPILWVTDSSREAPIGEGEVVSMN